MRPVRSITIPYVGVRLLARAVERYHEHSKGQLPAIMTPYKAAASWGGNRFDNAKLKALGWRPIVSTDEGMRRTFAWLRSQPAAH